MAEKKLVDEEVLQFLKGENSLLDGEISSIKIVKGDHGVNVSLDVSMRKSSQLNKIILDFIDCEEYSFSYAKGHYFYCIESVKFFKNDNEMYYLSLDPFEEGEQESSEDMDVIIARSVKLNA
jgi:hypothetical protein